MTTSGDPNDSRGWDDPQGRRDGGGSSPGERPPSDRPPYGQEGRPPGGEPPYGRTPGGGTPSGQTPGGGPPYGQTPGGGPPYGWPPAGEGPPGGQPPPYGPPPYGAGYGQPPGARGGLGTAAMVLGIVSLFLLLICGLGVLTAIVAIILGIIAVARNTNRGRGIAGIVLGALTIILAIIGFTWFYSNFEECFTLPTQAEAQQCVERKLGVNVQSPSP
ncbi:hypothetical protein Ssi03_57720 [Sphaerisporangium siamense]|uniref:DUF4190 domain-containing protein n=1 Tax=Sphaerisporangium siamense TaxID=795645 RepID=A0A7W7D4W1_9ACTN|nr:DUF4190 domain-containing protein [Sphaerisporangium siamense]MBB4700365.1 hypothetical protein [Sphaerisporangium siamense]GII87782.1 hypothetical protein Ssi03_57720 [Sphaerisporangium siamense]